eukprot:250757-Chlamydomonas_euryale.AAC.20
MFLGWPPTHGMCALGMKSMGLRTMQPEVSAELHGASTKRATQEWWHMSLFRPAHLSARQAAQQPDSHDAKPRNKGPGTATAAHAVLQCPFPPARPPRLLQETPSCPSSPVHDRNIGQAHMLQTTCAWPMQALARSLHTPTY